MALVGGTPRIRFGSRLARTGVLLLGLRCTPLSDFEVHQCDTHADCDIIDDRVVRCEDSRCVAGCTDNAHCESVDPRAPVCEAPGGDCVGLSSQRGECYASAGYEPIRMGEMALSDMLVIGVLAPTLRSSGWLSVQLAINEINSLGGLPGRSGARPVLAVLCDSSSNERLETGVDYLVQTLHVNTILAPIDDAALRALVGQPSTKGRALFLSPNGPDPWNGTAPDPDARALFLGADYGDALPMYGPVLRAAVASLLAGGKSADMLRIASVVSDTDEDRHLAAAIRNERVIAGKTFDQLELEYQARTFALQGEAWPVDAIVGYAPDLILVFAGGSSLSSPYRPRAGVVEALEARAAGSAWQPSYVISPRTGRGVELARLARENAAFRARSVTLSADRPVNEAASSGLGARFASAFPLALEPDARGVALEMYAGVYYLAYAAAASPAPGAAAAGVLAAMDRISDVNAEPIDIGPGGVSRAIELLGLGAPFNLQGASGQADFDALTGARPGAPHASCWLADGSLGERARSGAGSGVELELIPLDCAEAIFDAVAR